MALKIVTVSFGVAGAVIEALRTSDAVDVIGSKPDSAMTETRIAVITSLLPHEVQDIVWGWDSRKLRSIAVNVRDALPGEVEF